MNQAGQGGHKGEGEHKHGRLCGPLRETQHDLAPAMEGPYEAIQIAFDGEIGARVSPCLAMGIDSEGRPFAAFVD